MRARLCITKWSKRMKIVVLDAATLGSDLSLSPLEKLGEVTVWENTTPDEIRGRIEGQDVVILNKIKGRKKANG